MSSTPSGEDHPPEEAFVPAQVYRPPEPDALDRFFGIMGPSPRTADKLWLILVVGVFVILFGSLAGLIALLALGKSTDGLDQIIVGSLTGLFGLFAGRVSG